MFETYALLLVLSGFVFGSAISIATRGSFRPATNRISPDADTPPRFIRSAPMAAHDACCRRHDEPREEVTAVMFRHDLRATLDRDQRLSVGPRDGAAKAGAADLTVVSVRPRRPVKRSGMSTPRPTAFAAFAVA